MNPVVEGIFAADEYTGRVLGLLAGRCRDCAEVTFPYSPRCVACGAPAEPIMLSAEGTVFESTTVYSPAPGFTAPYVVGYVDLPEGVRLFCPLRTSEVRRLTSDVLPVDAAQAPAPGERVVFETIELTRGEETLMGYGFRVEGREVFA
jgi:uncharacterized OB-fold protein